MRQSETLTRLRANLHLSLVRLSCTVDCVDGKKCPRLQITLLHNGTRQVFVDKYRPALEAAQKFIQSVDEAIEEDTALENTKV